MAGLPVTISPDIPVQSIKHAQAPIMRQTIAQVTHPAIHKPPPAWFKPPAVSLPSRNPTYINDETACIFSPVEMDLSAKQFKHALIMNFSNGRPSLFDIKQHIQNYWKLLEELMVSLLDPRHILIIPSCHDDMIMALARDSHIIGTSMFRISRWTKDFQFGKDSTKVATWIRLPALPFIYFSLPYLERIGNQIGTFLRVDEKIINFQNLVHARLCVKIDVTIQRPSRIWIGESKEKDFWHKLEYEGNNVNW